MTRPYCLFIALVLLVSWIPQRTVAQNLQSAIQKTIAKVKPACVRLWGFDTLQQVRTSAQFSAVVVKDNYILTAAHVTIPGNTYKVMFPDGREAIAIALGKIELADDKTRPDVALMKILKGNWPQVETGSSAALQKLQPCLSIAYPESLNQTQPTVRLGKVTDPLNSRGFIHSTCLMEPGDSGGPLFDLAGKLIGLHSAIEVPEADNYDIPIDLYQKYRAALQQPVVYHNWPETVSNIKPRKALPALTDQPKAGNYEGACVKLNSRLDVKSQVVMGTVFSYKGQTLIVSKSSLIGNSVMMGQTPVSIIARDLNTDLVLLRPAATLKGGIKLEGTDSNIQAGSFLFAPLADTSTISGIISGGPLDLPKTNSAGFLGATPMHNSSPAKVYFVRAGSPAALNEIKTGDIVTMLNGASITDADAFADVMSKSWPGDTLKIKLKRGAEEIEKTIILTYPPDIIHDHPAEHFAGGKSRRRDGFRQIYTSDLILKPGQCGGPIFDARRHFCGLNIARYSRANSLLIKAADVKQFILMVIK
ncbi:trypsin-like peptidase domain-containing protein [Mucilaginibacter sp. UR6-11]|uniref:trypsin-like peptidase domain-containing protein n=1 Tax=Mucilaginibacter sp. UR6-11 TaxID=1435644 RepID=UPI001E560169|nr:trypsin-like peptidase domain-containing protein [Mucilaginibacter sp. UR6-11]MCC8426481.1 trypsin-like peptidase domain-containing protein [Mucilaginibacter sp. UR6-11]